MARRQGRFSDLLVIASKLPWQVSLGLAVVSGVSFHLIAAVSLALPRISGAGELGSVVVQSGIHTFAFFLQFILPAGLLIGAMVSVLVRARAGSLLGAARSNPAALESMRWRDFERLVGEAFRRQGYTVSGFGGSGPDGGVDLGLSKDGERFLVQCKHWKKRQVGVTVVRELNGVIAAQGAHGGFVVTGGKFSAEAQHFADACGIKLIDGPALEELVAGIPSRISAVDSGVVVVADAPMCPQCKTLMVRRAAQKGQFAGKPFWGCQQYPKCSGIVHIA